MLEFLRALEILFCPLAPLALLESTLFAELRISARDTAYGLLLSSRAARATATFGEVLRWRMFITVLALGPPEVVVIVLPTAAPTGLGVRSRCRLWFISEAFLEEKIEE